MEKKDNIIYGIHAVEELIFNRINDIDQIYFDSFPSGGKKLSLLKMCKNRKISCQCIPIQKLSRIAGTIKHQGIAARCNIKSYDTMDSLINRIESMAVPPVLLVPASCGDPRNLGALIRTSVAFNVTAILLERKGTAPLNSTVAKTSAGMLEYLSIIKPVSLEKGIKEFKDKGFTVVGMQSEATKKVHEINFTAPTIIITGGEHSGIPPYLKKLCTVFAFIPTTENVESLNVSVAASIALYECGRQRSFVFS